MNTILRFIREIHRRSLWQVLGIYLATSWALIQSVDSLAGLLGLPDWAPRLAFFLLLAGLPIVLATAFVQEGMRGRESDADRSEGAGPAARDGAGTATGFAPRRLFTWRNAVAGGVLAFALWGVVAAGWVVKSRSDAGDDPELKRIAVLPFENDGAADDEYFASGVADEIRTKLAGVPGLQVTARASTSQYAETRLPPQQIGKELEVDYLLTATVHWAKTAGMNRVRLHPELIKVADAATVWTETIEKELSDVFAVQTDIATKVASQLNLALGTRARERLSERPTGNLEAWDAYLRGEEITRAHSVTDVATLRRALPHFQRAVALDSTFAEAWSRIARVEIELDRLNPTLEGAERARLAAARAFALAPERAAGSVAMGTYLRVTKADNAAAYEHLRAGLQHEPNSIELLTATAATERSLGKFDSALVHLRRARDLDPRSVSAHRGLASAYLDLGRYREALASIREALDLAPTNIGTAHINSFVLALLGEVDSARAVVTATLARGADTTRLLSYYALIQEQMWLLPPELLPRVTQLTLANFDGNRGQWGLKVGATWKLLGDTARARAYADSAVQSLERHVRDFPDNAEQHELLGRALALAGRKDEAVREAELSLRMRVTDLDAVTGPYVRYQVVRILTQAGQQNRAIEELEAVMAEPGSRISPELLRNDPTFKSLRGIPAFERLIAPASR